MSTEKTKRVEYICTWCGRKEIRAATGGRPLPGACPRKGKTAEGKPKPHTWAVNRKV